jgi:hypothetical protein
MNEEKNKRRTLSLIKGIKAAKESNVSGEFISSEYNKLQWSS